jgi:hypothetical protein
MDEAILEEWIKKKNEAMDANGSIAQGIASSHA